MNLILAWRNIWRNKRRTFITLASIFFAVVLSTLMMSIKEGMYANMIDSMIGKYMGFGQIHAQDFWEERTLEYSFEVSDSLLDDVNSTKGIRSTLTRLESFAMAASYDATDVAMVVGIDADEELRINELNKQVSSGDYLLKEDKACLVGEGLAKHLKVGVNDTLVLLGQGYRGVNAAGKYLVKGLVKFGSPELSKQIVFLPLKEAQWFYGMEGRANNLILQFTDPNNTAPVINLLQTNLGDEYEVMGWHEFMPELKNMIETDRMEGYVFMFILYLVISFGILGTTIMMLAERKREFGVLVSIGMKRIKLAMVVWIEVLMITVVGAIAGMIGAFPVCYYFHVKPVRLGTELSDMMEEYGIEAVVQSSIEPSVFIQQAVVITLIAIVIAFYPFIKLMGVNAIKLMRT